LPAGLFLKKNHLLASERRHLKRDGHPRASTSLRLAPPLAEAPDTRTTITSEIFEEIIDLP
jgi:hypothetical protein